MKKKFGSSEDMDLNHIHEKAEIEKNICVFTSAVESLLSNDIFHQIWPEYIRKDKIFLEQIESRRELSKILAIIQSKINQADTPIENAIIKQLITEEEISILYNSLTDLLKNSHEYNRIVLYIPFEFLININWIPNTEDLRKKCETFKQIYLSTWKQLLFIHDVRANFVDGDVLEVQMREGDLPYVVKAAHLIPILVQKGWLDIEEIIKILEESKDKILRESIFDTFPILYDLGLLDKNILDKMSKSEDMDIISIARIISSYKKPIPKQGENIDIIDLEIDIDKQFTQIDSQDLGKVTKRRKEWIQGQNKAKIIKTYSEKISLHIKKGLFDKLININNISQLNIPTKLALIEGIREAIESTANNDLENANFLYNNFKEYLLNLWKTEDNQIQIYLQKLFFRLFNLKIVEKETLKSLNLSLPKLEGPFYKNLELMEEETKEIENMLISVESDSKLNQYIYPVVVIFGSKQKGYGTKDSDTDLGVFVKPDIPNSMREEVRLSLKKIFNPDILKGSVIEFWLEEKENMLFIRDTKNNDTALGDNLSTHILFGAAWEGKMENIQNLHAKLLTPYFSNTKEEIYGRNARDLYLEAIERDILQYRLMHKGYERYFPSYGGITTQHSDQIDGHSMFWDSGYRQLAIKLFVERIFLPKL